MFSHYFVTIQVMFFFTEPASISETPVFSSDDRSTLRIETPAESQSPVEMKVYSTESSDSSDEDCNLPSCGLMPATSSPELPKDPPCEIIPREPNVANGKKNEEIQIKEEIPVKEEVVAQPKVVQNVEKWPNGKGKGGEYNNKNNWKNGKKGGNRGGGSGNRGGNRGGGNRGKNRGGGQGNRGDWKKDNIGDFEQVPVDNSEPQEGKTDHTDGNANEESDSDNENSSDEEGGGSDDDQQDNDTGNNSNKKGGKQKNNNKK